MSDEPTKEELEAKADAVQRFIKLAQCVSNETDLSDEHILSAMIIAVVVCTKAMINAAEDAVTESEARDELVTLLDSAFDGIEADLAAIN
jgi:hypothetical protein